MAIGQGIERAWSRFRPDLLSEWNRDGSEAHPERARCRFFHRHGPKRNPLTKILTNNISY